MGVMARARAVGTVTVLAATLGTQVLVGQAQAATPSCQTVGAIGQAWTAVGGASSALGSCVANQSEFWVIQWQFFANGVVVWTPLTGAFSFLTNPPPVAGSTHGAAALAAAKTMIGTPYVWGGSAPGGFDCSGLAQWAFKQAGVNIPRTTYDQAKSGTYVPREQLQPGDLVFTNADLSHVGIYAGNDLILHAPDVGQTVGYANINSMAYNTARRY